MKLAAALVAITALVAQAQQPKQFTSDDYAQAEKFLAAGVNPLVYHSVERPVWLADGRFWFRDVSEMGTEFVMVSPVNKTKTAAFDHAKLAAALAAATGKPVDPHKLPFMTFELSEDDKTVTVSVSQVRYRCDLSGSGSCAVVKGAVQTPGVGRGGRPEAVTSPDKLKAAFIRNWNLWMRDVASGEETQLTTDGVEISAMPPTMRAGPTVTARFWCGRPIRIRSRRFNRTSARRARCIWCLPSSVIPSFRF